MLTLLDRVVLSDAAFVAVVLLVSGVLTVLASVLGVRLVDWWQITKARAQMRDNWGSKEGGIKR